MVDEGYFRHITEHPEISARDVALIRWLFPQARRVVDLGCGRGGFVAAGRDAGLGAIGVDNHPAAGRLCRSLGLPVVLGDGAALPFAAGALDVVRAKELIEHLEDPTTMLREALRVLRPGGAFMAHVPTHFSALYPIGNFWDDYTHVRPFSKLGLRRLLEDCDFEVTSIEGYTAGRNALERALGRALSLALPHTWLAVARKPA
jgi:SAM-dependent methyltransferase